MGSILSNVAKKGADIARKLGKNFLDKQIDRFNKEYIIVSGISLTNNEIKDTVKVIKHLENRRTLLKGTTRKVTSQKEGFLNFLRVLMAAGLALMKNVLTPLAKKILLPFGLSARMSPVNPAIQKKIYESGTAAFIIANEEMKDIMKIVNSLEESGLFVKGISETAKKETKKKDGFLQDYYEH